MDSVAASGIWSGLASAINEIHNQDASQLSFEELYRNAYNLVLHKHGEVLYKGVAGAVERHLEGVARGAAGTQDEALLAKASGIWSDHQLKMVMVRDSICMYMDRTYVVQQKKKPIYELGLQIFREAVWENPSVRPRLSRILLANVQAERTGQLIDRSLMKNALAMLVEIGGGGGGAYGTDFEVPLLEATDDFYKAESQE